jgi:hypothetical protein
MAFCNLIRICGIQVNEWMKNEIMYQKPYEILRVQNTLVKSVYYVKQYTICSLVKY